MCFISQVEQNSCYLDFCRYRADSNSSFCYKLRSPTAFFFFSHFSSALWTFILSNVVEFVEVQSDLSQDKIVDVIFKKLRYQLPGSEKINRRKPNTYFGKEDGFTFLNLSDGHAYIYVGESDGRVYQNKFSNYLDFIYRNNSKKPNLCSKTKKCGSLSTDRQLVVNINNPNVVML